MLIDRVLRNDLFDVAGSNSLVLTLFFNRLIGFTDNFLAGTITTVFQVMLNCDDYLERDRWMTAISKAAMEIPQSNNETGFGQ